MSLCGMPYDDEYATDADVADIWEEGYRRARKPRSCSECGRSIETGERYGWAKALSHGEGWATWSRCSECLTLAEYIGMETGLCPLWGALHEAANDLDEGPPTNAPTTWDRFHPKAVA